MTASNDLFSSIALPLALKGYAVFPLEPGGKKPITQHGCKDATTDQATIQNWAVQDGDANVGIHCGGMVVLDLDVKDGKNGIADLAEMVKTAGLLPEHPVVRTPTGGEHHYFHTTAKFTNKVGVPFQGRKTGIDIRTGGGYVVAPGSRLGGFSGQGEYTAQRELPRFENLPELPESWVHVLRPPISASAPQLAFTNFKTNTNDKVLDRASAYLDKCDPSIQGQNGSGALYRAVSLIMYGFLLDDATVKRLVLERFNPRCQPPWTDADKDGIDHKIRDARANPLTEKPLGWLLEERVQNKRIADDPGIDALVQQCRDTLPMAEAAQSTGRKPPFGVYSHVQLLNMDLTPKFLIEDVLVEGQPMIVGAPRKCLKTSILLDMAVSLGGGDHFLGRFEVLKPCKVLIMSGESGLATILETVNRICQQKASQRSNIEFAAGGQEISVPWDRLVAKGVIPIADNVLISDAVPTLADMEHMDALNEILETEKPGVVIFDPAYLMMDGEDAGNVMAMGKQLRGITEICTNHKATMVLAHHFTKGSQNADHGKKTGMPDLNDLSWSGFAEFARQWILLNRKKLYESGTGEHYLNMVIGGSVGFGGMYSLEVKEGQLPDRFWQPTLKKLERDKPQPDISLITELTVNDEKFFIPSKEQKTVLDFLKENSDGVSKTGIRKLKGCGEKAGSILKELIDAAQIVVKREHRNGSKEADYYYSAAQSGPEKSKD